MIIIIKKITYFQIVNQINLLINPSNRLPNMDQGDEGNNPPDGG